MYMSLGLLRDALMVFDEIPDRGLAEINAVVSGLARNGHLREAFSVFRDEISFWDFRPNSVTVASFLSSCEESVEIVEMIHCWAVKLGVDKDVFVATAIISAYSRSGEEETLVVSSTSKVFEEMWEKNIVSYNAHMSYLLRRNRPFEVLKVFKEMTIGFDPRPNPVSLVSAISASARLSFVSLGQQIHGLAMKLGLELNGMVGKTLVYLYSRLGLRRESREIYDELRWDRDSLGLFNSATCNSMISGFLREGKSAKAFECFRRMQSAGISPDVMSMTSVLTACSEIPALRSGKEVHGHATRTLVNNGHLVTALVDLYMKCGLSCSARKVFEDVASKKCKDPAVWNAMVFGFVRNGDHSSAFELLDRMTRENLRPNDATFAGVLSACGDAGKVEKGLEIFKSMSEKFDVGPKPNRLNGMIELLARWGKLREARELMKKLPEPSSSVCASILGACRSSLDPELGKEMAERLIELDPENPMPYVVLSDIYAELERWRDVEMIQNMMDHRRHRKVAGSSLLEAVQ